MRHSLSRLRSIWKPVALAAAMALGPAPTALAKCDYKFSGTLLVQNNGEKIPLRGVKVRVKRQGGTGLGRSTVRTDDQGRFSGAWSFARDRDGIGPGRKDIRFAVQTQFRNDDVKVALGGWTEKPWDTFAEVEGKDCLQFILPTHVFDNDTKSDTKYTAHRAFIYAVHERLLRKLKQENVGLKNRIEVIYPDRHIYSRDSSWFLHKSHIENGDWEDVRTLIHETMHQWDVNWLKGEKNLVCIADAHHKPPSRWASSRCSGFMEGFAEAMARALFNDIFAGEPFFTQRGPYNGPQDHEALRNDTDSSGSVQTRDEAERNDDGWRNFLQFVMWGDEWAPFDDTDTVVLPNCQPSDVGVYDLLAALKSEAASKASFFKGNATFPWFTDIMERQVSGFSQTDARFYEMFGDPSLSAEDIQQQMCADELAELEANRDDFIRDATSDLREDLAPDVTPVRPDLFGPRPADFSGSWSTSFGELRLHQVDGYLVGDYARRGIIAGRVKGTCVAGVFTNGKRKGIFRFNKAPGDASFSGQWAWHGDPLSGEWTGDRTSAESPSTLSNVDYRGQVRPVVEGSLSHVSGQYDSSFGDVDLLMRDRILIGNYGTKNVLIGIWDSNSFAGRFTNGERVGWFDFDFLPTGAFKDGEWGWNVGDTEGAWTLTQRDSTDPVVDNLNADVSCP